MNDEEFKRRIKVALDQRPKDFAKVLRTTREVIGGNTFDIRRLTYDFDPDTDVVTVLSDGSIVAMMTQEFFDNLAKHR